MHLLFYGHEQVELLETKKIEDILREQSIKQGKQFDNPESAESIEHFVKTYSLQLDELLQPDLSQYKTFNEFFYRCVCLSSESLPNLIYDLVLTSTRLACQ